VATWLELDFAGETIAGQLHEDDRPPRAFSGWLELVALVEAARERGAAPEAPGPGAGVDASQLATE
jgi:hypothetical protein